METLSVILLAAALLAVLASLVVGLFAMARGKEQDAALSQKMMRMRVTLQGVALAAFLIAVVARG